MTDRQRQVFDFIAEHIAQHGWAPSFREIADHLQIRNGQGVTDHLKALQRDGWIDRGPARAFRCIRILRRPS